MSLYSISGFDCGCGGDCSGCGSIGSRASRRAKRAQRRAKRKARKTGINCRGAKGKMIALAAPRNAYLALVRLNFKKFAVKLHKATSTTEGRAKVHQKWCKLGGNGRKLQSAIDKAYAKYARKHKIGEIGYMDTDGMIGVVSTATLLASAAPIIAALAPLLKQFGGEKGQQAAELLEQGGEMLEQNKEGIQQFFGEDQQQSESGEVGAIGINPWIIGGGALALLLLLRKKK